MGAHPAGIPYLRYLWDFLNKQHRHMPKWVRVVTYVFVLILAALPVLHAFLGVSYVEGKVTELYVSNAGEPKQRRVEGVKIYRDRTQTTDVQGEFAVRIAESRLPLTRLNFTFEYRGEEETVPVEAPWPLYSLFNPNRAEIYYVPGSRATNKLGSVQRYFTDWQEAKKAREQLISSPGAAAPKSGLRLAPAPGLLFAGPLRPGATQEERPRPRLLWRGLRNHSQGVLQGVYFDLHVEGRETRATCLPSEAASHADYLEIAPQSQLQFNGCLVELPHLAARVDLRVYRHRFLPKDVLIDTLSYQFQPEKDLLVAGNSLSGNLVAVETELLPPVRLGYQSAALPGLADQAKTDRSFLAAALQAYDRALGVNQKIPLILNNYAYFVADVLGGTDRPRLEKARRLAEEAARMEPTGSRYDTLGWTSYHLKDWTTARGQLERARSLQQDARDVSTWQYIHYHLGRTYLEPGERKQAAEAFQEVQSFSQRLPMQSVPELLEGAGRALALLAASSPPPAPPSQARPTRDRP
jgi:tetratricopeptide (TPR) repeat protein